MLGKAGQEEETGVANDAGVGRRLIDVAGGPPDHSPTNDHGAVGMPDGGERAGQGLLGGYDVGEQVGFLLRRAHQRHASLFQEAMVAVDLTPMQFNALVRVVELGAVSQNQLGRLSAMDPATIQGVVRRLVERGLMQRGADPTDRRASVLTPTASGLALAERAAAIGHAVTDATLGPLSVAERRLFLKLLGKMS